MEKVHKLLILQAKRSMQKLLLCVIFLFATVLFLVFSMHPVSAATGINKQINFQGKLTNADGTNVVDNTYTVVFSIYNVSSGGSNTWTESDSVTTVNGIFQVSLGAVTTLPGSVDFNQDTWYLGIKVGSDAEMTPRIRLAAVPYAFNAATVGGITFSGTSGNTYTLPSTNNGTILTSNAPTQSITGVLGLTNSTSNSGLTVTATANPTAGQALLFASDTNAAPSGNLLDLQSGSSPTSKLSVNTSGDLLSQGTASFGSSGHNGIVTLNMQSADNFSAGLRVQKRGATGDATASLSSGAEIGYHEFYGWDGTAYGRGAYAITRTTEAWSGTGHGTSYAIAVTPNGSTTNTEVFTIGQDGGVTGKNWSVTAAGGLTVTSCSGCGGGGSTSLNSVLAATGTSTIANGDNAITWNWAPSTAGRTNFTFGNTTAPSSGTNTALALSLTHTSNTMTNGFLVNVNGSGGTTTNGIQISQTAGTLTNGLTFSGTMTNLISAANFVVKNDGSVGIGTTSPSDLLQIVKNSGSDLNIIFQNQYAGKAAYIETLANSNYSGFVINGTGQQWNVGQNGSADFTFEDVTNSNALPVTFHAGAPTNSLVVGATGHVGIGTATPYSVLTTENSGTFSNTENVTNGFLTETGHTTSDYGLYMGSDATNGVSYMQSVHIGTDTAPLLLNQRGGMVSVGGDGTNLPVTSGAQLVVNNVRSYLGAIDGLDVLNTSSATITNGMLVKANGSGGTTNGIQIQQSSGTLATGLLFSGTMTTNINLGTVGTGSTGMLANLTGTGTGLQLNTTGTGNVIDINQNGADRFTVAANGGLTINGADSSIVRTASTDFSSGTVGSNLTNSNGYVQLADGTPGGSGQGVLTTTAQPALAAALGAGAQSITRSDGKYLVINGGASLATQIYDPAAGTFTASNSIVTGNGTAVGAGALLLPRPNGQYLLILGAAAETTAATANIDPMQQTPNTAGPALNAAITGAGTVAFKRLNGKFLVTNGASTPVATTQVYDPVANSFAAGPSAATGNWSAGALAIPMADGRALIVNGGSTSTTNIYNPNGTSATVGMFTVGPSLDGAKVAGSCGINGAGSVALKRQDGKYVILSKSGAEAVFDPSAVTMTCTTGVSNVSVLGDGAHAIPLQNGKFLIFAGGNTTNAFIYNQDSDTFSAWGGTTPTAITTGAHSILKPDGTWQVLTGTSTTTNNFNTNLPMSDPFPGTLNAAVPTAGGSCTAGTHAYYTTFVGASESELSNKSAIVSCTAGNGTVALTQIPLGPYGTTARKIYRTVAGDTGTPKLLTTISDNSTTTFSDTIADGSLGATYSLTASTTWYTSEDISSTYLNINSYLKWTAQLEAVYSADRNSGTNTSFKVVQFFVKTAVNTGGGCATPLTNAPWIEIQNSGDSIHAITGATCVKVSIHFNRAMPKRLADDRGTWTGNNSTILRLDYTTPSVFDYTISNAVVLKQTAFDFSTPDSTAEAATIPTAPTSAAPGGSGSCTSGNHFWFVSFVINGTESQLSPASSVQSCSGSNAETLTLPTGPSGTTARKIYRTAAGYVVTDTPFFVGVVNDNATTSFVDNLADSSLGTAFTQLTASGPTMTRAESTRVEMVNNQLTLPWGRVYASTPNAVSNTHGLDYPGVFGNTTPNLNNPAGAGTFVIARDDKTFLVVEGGGATADVYDPATNTFINQSGTGNVPTAAVGPGAFALRRPDGKYLVLLGNNTATTNIYDQYAPPGARFTLGPSITGTAINQGAFAMQNADGTYTILPGNAATTTSLYDPVRNTMTVGPLQTTGTNYGALAIPMAGPMNNNYKVLIGTTLGGGVGTGTMNYNAATKVFTAGQALGVGIGNGALAFQRQDGFWVLLKGESAANTLGTTTSLVNPYTGVEIAGPALSQAVNGRGTTVIPRADGTFLITSGNSLAAASTGNSVATVIYIPWGSGQSTTTAVGTANLGASVNGPTMVEQGGVSSIAAPTTSAPASGGSNLCDTGTHLWRYTYVLNGTESALSTAGTVQTCTVTTAGQEALTAVSVGPTGTTARKIYRTKAGTTSPYYLVATISDNATTTYNDSAADSSLSTTYWAGGPGDGAVSFQRPDGKYMTIFGASTWTTIGTQPGSTTTTMYDAGWYADGQYLSEEMNVPAMAANSILDWQQTADQFVRFAVRTAASQTALGVTNYRPIAQPGGSIGNAANDNWVQVQINFRRDFPTYSGVNTGVYNSTSLAYTYRTISTPQVNSYQITNGQDLLTLQTNGVNMLRVTSDGNIMSSAQGGFFTGGADLAERYTSSQSLMPGEVVTNDPASTSAVMRSTNTYQPNLLGIVSTDPGFVAGAYTENSYPIALSGRVPVLVSNENGPIHAGDYITSGSIPGYAMKAVEAGQVIGKAMEDFDGSTGSTCPAVGMGAVASTSCGKIMVFVNLIDYLGTPLDVVMNDHGMTFVGDDTGSSMTVVPADAAHALTFLQNFQAQKASGSAYTSEIFTDNLAATTRIIAPELVTDTLYAKHIHADSIDGLDGTIASLSARISLLETLLANPSATASSVLGASTEATDAAHLGLALDEGVATVSGDLRVQGNSLVEGVLHVVDTLTAGNMIVTQLATFLGDSIFHGNVSFLGNISVNGDHAGTAIVAAGSDHMDVVFTSAYATRPIITASITVPQDMAVSDQNALQQAILNGQYSYVITQVSERGFTIRLNKPASVTTPFSWTAVSVGN